LLTALKATICFELKQNQFISFALPHIHKTSKLPDSPDYSKKKKKIQIHVKKEKKKERKGGKKNRATFMLRILQKDKPPPVYISSLPLG